jgi:hypothetical protein
MNALNQYRLAKALTCSALARLVGYNRSAVWKHCFAKTIPAEAAIRYANALGIPFSDLRPDLFPSASSVPPPDQTAAPPHLSAAAIETAGRTEP